MVKRRNWYLDKMRRRAKSGDLSALSGRKGKERTEAINETIIRIIDPAAGDTVLDIGCGDASLLEAISPRIRAGTGVVPTEEEHALLVEKRKLHNVDFKVALSNALPLPDDSFDIVIFNGVILVLGSLAEAEASIAEIARVAKPGAKIWMGEVVARKRFVFQGLHSLLDLLTWKRTRILVTPMPWLRSAFARHGLVLEPQIPHDERQTKDGSFIYDRLAFVLRNAPA
jgi:ubiquinone/menaquinone biosynthesis C-methylase UbiE